MFAIMSMVIGTHTLTSNFRPLLVETGVDDPFAALRDNIQVLLDGFGWRPLSTEWDYAATYDSRIIKEVFADEFPSSKARLIRPKPLFFAPNRRNVEIRRLVSSA